MSRRTFLTTMILTAVVLLLLLAQMVTVSEASPIAKKPTPTPTGPTPTPTHTPEPGTAEWTLMFYMAGDNDLERYVTLDIQDELAQPGSNPDVNVVAIADRHPGYDNAAGDWTSTKLFYVTQGMAATPENAVADWGERNMGDPETLIDFVQWAQTNYPANRYALVLWDHGWGWRPYQVMWDETDDDTLDLHEIDDAMDVVGPIDLVAYDACEMQMIEVEAAWRSYTPVIVASQENMGFNGFRYNVALSALQATPSMTTEQFGIELAQTATDNWTIAVVTLNGNWDALVTAVDEWSVALLGSLPTYEADYDAAWSSTQDAEDRTHKDLYDAAEEIKARVGDSTIQARCQAVMDAVDAVILYEWHQRSYKDTHGIGIFWPKEVADLDEPSSPQWNDFQYYQDYLAFSQLTHWDEFLDAYVNGQ
jgi:hypothetical protein